MRLFELAKELNTSSRELLRQAETLDVDVSTYISPLDSDDLATLRKNFKPRSVIDIADDEAAMRRKLEHKKAEAQQKLAEAAGKNAEALRASVKRAKAAYAARKAQGTGHSEQPATEDAAPDVETLHTTSPEPAPVPESAEAEPAEAAPEETAPAPKPAKAKKVAKKSLEDLQPETAPVAESVDVPPAAPEISAEPAVVAESPAEEPKAAPAASNSSSSLRALPPRPMQAPRPEVQVRSIVPKPAPKPAPKAAEPEKATALPTAAKPAGAKPAAPAKEAVPKKPKRPVAFHPEDDEEEELLDVRVIHGMPAKTHPGAVPVARAKKSVDRDDRAGFRRGDKTRGDFGGRGKPGDEPETAVDSKTLILYGPILVKDLATRLGVRPNIIITQLMKMGVLASINQSVDIASATKIAQLHGFTVEQEKTGRQRSAENRPVLKRADAEDDIPEDRPDQLRPRPPVVTFLGHVDHGKTSLMDRIRSASVASGEAGGITQHIGAYTVEAHGHPITFLDTPGHAAFSAMRARGANLTDIAVIIIAADDGIMPQTKEAIKHAQKANVTIMIAINKCDLPQANPTRIMQQLQGESLTPEEWGGDVVVCQVSAHTGDGVDHLLEMILLQTEMLELTANPDRRANGTVIEAQMEPGSGPTASILVTGGTLNVGDIMLCGEYYGRVRALIDSSGKRIKSVKPSGAARVMGLSGVPEAGAEFRVMKNEKRAKELAEEYAQEKKQELLGGVTQAKSVDDIFKKIHEAGKLNLDIILRADVQGSVEAVEDSIMQIKSDKVVCNIIQSGTGAITSNDVQRAASGKAIIVGFSVSPEPGVNSEARHNGVRIRTFRIIYELLDFIKQEMLDLLPVEHREVVRGHALVRQVFTLNRIGVAAGSVVTDGEIVASGKARVFRNKKLIHTGDFASLRHYKDEVKELANGQECGILLKDYENFQEGDIIECFAFEALPKTL